MRDRARAMRLEFKRHSKDPQWAIDGAPAPRTVAVDAHAAASLLGLAG